MCIDVYISVCVYVFMCIDVYISVCVYVFMCIDVYISVCVHWFSSCNYVYVFPSLLLEKNIPCSVFAAVFIFFIISME